MLKTIQTQTSQKKVQRDMIQDRKNAYWNKRIRSMHLSTVHHIWYSTAYRTRLPTGIDNTGTTPSHSARWGTLRTCWRTRPPILGRSVPREGRKRRIRRSCSWCAGHCCKRSEMSDVLICFGRARDERKRENALKLRGKHSWQDSRVGRKLIQPRAPELRHGRVWNSDTREGRQYQT